MKPKQFLKQKTRPKSSTPLPATAAAPITIVRLPTATTGATTAGAGAGMPTGMPDLGRLTEQMTRNPDMMQQLMSSPMMDGLLNNPEMMQQMMMQQEMNKNIIFAEEEEQIIISAKTPAVELVELTEPKEVEQVEQPTIEIESVNDEKHTLESLNKLKIVTIKEICKNKNIPIKGGNKEYLIQKILEQN
jgi:hypothetical protein